MDTLKNSGQTENHSSDSTFQTENHSSDSTFQTEDRVVDDDKATGQTGGASKSGRRWKTGNKILGRYVVKDELGQGGMGVVYRCFDEVGRTEVAVKCLPSEVSHNPAEMEDVRDNYTLVVKLSHQNIADYMTLEHDTNTGDYYLVMDYVEGDSLRHWMKQMRRGGKLSLEAVLPVLRQIAEALDTAHRQGIIHRDIKPDNVKIRVDGTVKVLDFGLAAQIRSSLSHVSTEYAARAGTNLYKSPEQWRGRPQGAAADQYALAVTAYEMLSGHVPFDDDDPNVLKKAVLEENPMPIDGLPAYVNTALQTGLAKEASDRYANCVDFVRALGGEKVKSSGGKPNGRLWLVAAVVALVLAVGGMAYFMRYQDTVSKGVEEVARQKAAAGREAAARPAADKAAARAAEVRRTAAEAFLKQQIVTLALDSGVELKLVKIAAGSFMMGSPLSEEGRFDNEKQHKVTLTKDFWLGRWPVTQGQWQAVMGTTLLDQANKAYPGEGEKWIGNEGGDYPMYFVSWEEAMEFCGRLTERERSAGRLPEGYEYALPTESQWEYACRAGTGTALYSGGIRILGKYNAPALDGIAWYGGNSSVGYEGRGWDTKDWKEKQYPGGLAGPRLVGRKSPNAWGLYDMLGNVYEWCRDWYDDYPDGNAVDPKGPTTGSYRVLRGGSWDGRAGYCRSALRNYSDPAYCYYYFGFRVALASVQ
ncbi:MAG: SUMF1/EgtB/PvdO family nonheme iron enzyme [Lentisphaeria bacterium]|nr:SUMF1/EgtB/PvdO family nonheme iron enzyme [Lentisphaeria bacterium]